MHRNITREFTSVSLASSIESSARSLPFGLGRRHFLRFGSAFSASLLFPGILKAFYTNSSEGAGEIPAAILKPELVAFPLAIGFCSAQDSPAASERHPGSILPAQSLPSCDREFIQRGITLQIHGLSVPPETWLKSLTVYVHYRPQGMSEDVKVCAWCFDRDSLSPMSAARRLFVPVVDRDRPLKISLDWVTASNSKTSSNPDSNSSGNFIADSVVLEWGDRDHQIKLHRGTYLIAGTWQGTDQLPQWPRDRWQLLASSPASIGEIQASGFNVSGSNPAPISPEFAYLWLSADYG